LILPPIDVPDSINADAWFAFEAVIEACGKTFFRMPTSCEFFLKKHLGEFPEERDLLIAALRQGIPQAIIESGQSGEINPVLARLTQDLHAKVGGRAEAARWAVEAWSAGLGKPPGTVSVPVVRLTGAPKPPPPKAVGDKSVRAITAGIAALGGALGGGLGNGGAFSVIYLSGMAVDGKYGNLKPSNQDYAILILFLILMTMGAMAGAFGAFMGWWLGRGNERPWAGFGAAFGAAFGTGCITTFLVGPGLGVCFGMGLCAFGAAFTCAARGGRTN